MRKGYFMGKTKDPAKIIKKLEEKIEKLEAQIEESPKKGINLNSTETVSYTHLTLPTICSV